MKRNWLISYDGGELEPIFGTLAEAIALAKEATESSRIFKLDKRSRCKFDNSYDWYIAATRFDSVMRIEK